MRLDRGSTFDIVEMAKGLDGMGILGPFRGFTVHVNEIVREARIEVVTLFDLLNILGTQF